MNMHDHMAGIREPGTAMVVDARSPQEHDAASMQSGTSITADLMPCGGRPFQATWVFPAVPAAVTRARRQLHRLMCRSGLSSIADDVALGAQELMANAVAHGCCSKPVGEFIVKASCLHGRVRVEVQDASDEWPLLRPASDDREGGRGLILVDALVASWGVQPGTGRGKTVWMELDVPCEEAVS